MDKLITYLRDNGISQAAFAARVGVGQATVSKLCAGQIAPSLQTAAAIEKATNGAVPMSSWIESAA
jgi:transcriptional regulator with XRE-family HTH domain